MELAFIKLPGCSFVLFEPSGALLTNGSAGLLRWPVQTEPASAGLLRIGPPHKLSVPGPICHIARSGDGGGVAGSPIPGRPGVLGRPPGPPGLARTRDGA